MTKNVEASEIATAIMRIIDGRRREDVMAALCCATGRALASIGIPAEAMPDVVVLFEKQIREHHAKYLEEVKAHVKP